MAVLRRCLSVASLVMIAVQLTLTAAGTLIACANTQHMHNGRPAPDCPMHHAPDSAASTPAGHEHHHHSSSHTDDGGRLACGCSSDLPAFLIAGSAVMPPAISVGQPASRAVTRQVATTMTLQRFNSPFTPPPRLPLA